MSEHLYTMEHFRDVTQRTTSVIFNTLEQASKDLGAIEPGEVDKLLACSVACIIVMGSIVRLQGPDIPEPGEAEMRAAVQYLLDNWDTIQASFTDDAGEKVVQGLLRTIFGDRVVRAMNDDNAAPQS